MTDEANQNLRQPVDNAIRSTARMLIRTAHFGALGVLTADGAPSVARVGLATDTDGLPIFPVSSLSDRVAQMTADNRVSLLIGDPGRGDPLAQGRLTLHGLAGTLDGDECDRARRRYLARHPDAGTYIDFADFSLWRLKIEHIDYIAGFGRAYRLSSSDVRTEFADWSGWNAMEGGAVEHMNDDHSDATRLYATVFLGADDGHWRITGLDPQGIDMALGNTHRRFEYEKPLTSAAELRPALVSLVKEARARGAMGD